MKHERSVNKKKKISRETAESVEDTVLRMARAELLGIQTYRTASAKEQEETIYEHTIQTEGRHPRQ